MSLSRILNHAPAPPSRPLPPPSPPHHALPFPFPPSTALHASHPRPLPPNTMHAIASEDLFPVPPPTTRLVKYRGLSPYLDDPKELAEDFGLATLDRPASDYHPFSDSSSKKRRKRTAELPPAPEPGPPVQRRSSRRHKKTNTEAHISEAYAAELQRNKEIQERLASSDLEDCEEVWIADLSVYVLETHKRRCQVEEWYNDTALRRNTAVAQRLSHHYTDKMAKIPLRPPTPPPIVPLNVAESSSFAHHLNPRIQGTDQHESDFDLDLELDDAVHARPLHRTRRGKTKEKLKRTASAVFSDSASEAGSIDFMAPKRRRLDPEILDVDEMTPLGSCFASARTWKGKGKGKQIQREPSVDSISATPKSRKKGAFGGRKRVEAIYADTFGALNLPPGSAVGSVDASPSASRLNSPAPGVQTIIWELNEVAPPLKKAKKVDDATMFKRVKALEEAQRKVWTTIARRDVAKVYKYQLLGYQARQAQAERIAKLASMSVRKAFVKTPKANKDIQAKAKRLMREMQLFWKKNEKEERDVRKREQKEALDRAKIEEEAREAARQARKLEFLISQSEIYSHFVGSKLKTSELEGETAGPVPVGADLGAVDASTLTEIDFDDEDQTNLHRHANYNAQQTIALARQKAQDFDTQTALDRKKVEANGAPQGQNHLREDAIQDENEDVDTGEQNGNATTGLIDLDSDELNFQNPTSLKGPLLIAQPQMLMAQLKEYQLKGLNWLATLYEQGINGILADEMGLGKTIQSISLIAYLAETHDIWGPFLVVAPASTLHNWQQEITRFVPGIKALPYWGNVKDRATLRKFWSKKEINYNQDAPFHVLITSYQLVTQDQQYFQRVKWQYMILDEAQNIKNSSSVRWKTLLGFQCRNRLLLTGTPIQNSMQELWALLHFIMPSLFDSHDEFNEWFSKDIENAAENKGSKLNEHQLRRLHMILKPFMLRRVKRHVQNELGDKIEKDIFVDLSPRQRTLYKALRANISVSDLLNKARNIGDAESARSLMNLVMQFRKVCNHPELFERADVVAPFSFARFGQSGPLNREGDILSLPNSTCNPIEYHIPRLLYLDGGLLDVPQENSTRPEDSSYLTKLMNIWSTDWMHESLYEDGKSSSFAFLRLLDISPGEAHGLQRLPSFLRQLKRIQEESFMEAEGPFVSDPSFAAHSATSPFHIRHPLRLSCFKSCDDLPPLREISTTSWRESYLSRQSIRWYSPPVVAPPINIHCDERCFIDEQIRLRDGGVESLALYGLPPMLSDSTDACTTFCKLLPGIPFDGIIGGSPENQLPSSYMHAPEAKRLIYDSAKLARLDTLLQDLKAGDHRVLIYFQMTRMMDLMEEYLIYRQYKYLRLDGSSKLEDRRDMVTDWQTKPEIFVFLLSTRAGGLGINLTAADTVVFYDHDWNPSNDAQAMDRAHRLGQTRQVTVYRLITKGTIDERIVQMARVKKDVQDIVVGNKNFADAAKPSDIVQLLLNDEQLANLESTPASSLPNGKTTLDGGQPKVNGESARDLWNEEGDYFFGAPNGTGGAATSTVGEEEGTPGPSTVSRRGKRGGTNTPRGGGRKGTGGGRKKKAGAATGYVPED